MSKMISLDEALELAKKIKALIKYQPDDMDKTELYGQGWHECCDEFVEGLSRAEYVEPLPHSDELAYLRAAIIDLQDCPGVESWQEFRLACTPELIGKLIALNQDLINKGT